MSAALIIIRNASDALVATPLIRRLSKSFVVHCMSDDNLVDFFRFCAKSSERLSIINKPYDLVINLSPSLICSDVIEQACAKEKLGFGRSGENLRFFNEGADQLYRAKIIGIPSDANYFQLLFGAANLVWQGEGYEIPYFPRNRTKKLTGIAIRDHRIKKHISENLKVNKMWQVPFKHNLLKQLDEVNRCQNIITDDETVMHCALSLRKKVEFISRKRIPYRIEMFKSGNSHIIDI
jgi:hypothetical protein